MSIFSDGSKVLSFQEVVERIGFDINKYDSFEMMSDFDLLTQISGRNELSYMVKILTDEDLMGFYEYALAEHYIENYSCTPQSDCDIERLIPVIVGKYKRSLDDVLGHYADCFSSPVIDVDGVKFLASIQRKDVYNGFVPNMMSFSDIVKPISRFSLEGLVFNNPSLGEGIGRPLMLTSDEIEDLDENDSEKLFNISNESISIIFPDKMRMPNNADDFGHAIHLSIDIAKNDNDILDSLAKLLPIWRKELKISEPEKKRTWSYIRDRIISYRIIPLIDLLEFSKIYTKVTKKRVSRKTIAFLTYPHGEQDQFGLAQTVLPFLEKVKMECSKFFDEYKINKD
ncbi:DUF6387 family protein [Raoultella ornithinolytica]|uniref:DUF6387 family protein n=1 Tax=Raoultella ornithinolytica TaxID=54291 RepID=UPI00292B0C00|nr:DUF6387 family protein [Raoultella ornithinolytica]MDV0603663.1 DUF6387 family protein [Raoultella ornithinolytica]